MITSKEIGPGTIHIVEVDEEKNSVAVQLGNAAVVWRTLKKKEGPSGADKAFKFIGTEWLLAYDFGIGRETPAKEEQLPFFVYGTLRTGHGNWHHYFKGRTVKTEPATTSGRAFIDEGSIIPYLFEDEESTVRGELMYVNPKAYPFTLDAVDGLEGYYGPKARYNHYIRQAIVAETATGEKVKAWVYYANDDIEDAMRRGLIEIPDGDYSQYMLNYRPQRAAGRGRY